ncbi:MAG TPA: FtsX-like permease family protein [Crenotrichaceae bacterium]|nr:FtsX-like permease family protein [Crenotrichaceae bacterium]
MTVGIHQMRHVAWLALKDYLYEWRLSSCFVLALAAVLAPMMILFGLKFGVVSSMVNQLVEDPQNQEIRPVGSGRFGLDWFAEMAARPDVAFIIPRTRTLSATMQLQRLSGGSIVSVELIPSAKGDPLLGESITPPEGLQAVVLSASAARKLDVSVGDKIDGSLHRRYQGKRERVHMGMVVTAINNEALFSRDGAFVSLDIVVATEKFRDGYAVPELGWLEGEVAYEPRLFPGYRLYARSIYDVAPLQRVLYSQGLEVRAKTADIEVVQNIDKNLSILFWVIALIGITGASFSLGASLWANVDRKRKELSILRLVGLRTGSIVWFPTLQGIFTGILGWLLACVIYLIVETSINLLLVDLLNIGGSICRLLPSHFLIAGLLTVGAALVASALAGYRVSRVEPSDGLRDL